MMDRSNWIIVIAAVIAAALGGWLQHASRAAHVPPGVTVAAVGDLRPDLLLTGVDGTPHRLSDFHGRRVLLNFWASWCGPCLAEMPALDAAQRKFGDQGAIVLGIAMDDPTRVAPFLSAHPVSYPVLLGQMSPPSTSMSLGDPEGDLPYNVLLDRDGRILAAQRGALSPEKIAQWLGLPEKR